MLKTFAKYTDLTMSTAKQTCKANRRFVCEHKEAFRKKSGLFATRPKAVKNTAKQVGVTRRLVRKLETRQRFVKNPAKQTAGLFATRPKAVKNLTKQTRKTWIAASACALLAMIFLAPVPAHACTSPVGVAGEMIFSEDTNVPTYCDGTNWIAMVGTTKLAPASCPNIGDQCNDGSVYAGLSPDGDFPMYTTPTDAQSTTWGNAGSLGPAGAAGVCGSGDACFRGENNTEILAEDAVTYPAAEYCYNLKAHNIDDWYLPARDELIELWNARNTGALSGTFDGNDTYYSSSDGSTNSAIGVRFLTGGGAGAAKGTLHRMRCVRKQNPTEIVPSGLIRHWRLDETTGTTVFDSSGSGFDGTMLGGLDAAADNVDAIIGTGIDFDGATNDSINLGEITMLDTGSTVSFWAKIEPNIAPNQRVYSNTSGHFCQLRLQPSGRYTLECRLNGTVSGFSGFTLNDFFEPSQWYHIAISRDKPSGKVYVNNIEAANFNDTMVGDRSGNDLVFGLPSFGEEFYGVLDDFRIYNRALTPEEIAEIYAARDGIRYNESHRTPEYFDGNQFVSLRPDFPEPGDAPILEYPDLACPNIGDVCSDGSVYAGISPDGDVPMYTTPCNVGMTWNGSTCTGTSTGLAWSTATSATGVISDITGEANTSTLENLVDGGEPYPAAQHCADLSAHGHNDWYLPALNEYTVLYTNRAAIGSFITFTGYWTSRQNSTNQARGFEFTGGTDFNNNKDNLRWIRCTRRADLEVAGTAGLIGHWKLDETEGTTASDSSGNGNDGTMEDGLDAENDSAPGAIGTSLSHDGVDDQIRILDPGADSVFDFDNGEEITLSAWVQDNITSLAANDFHTILVKSAQTFNQANYGLQVEEGDLTFFYRNAANDTWHIYTSDISHFSQAGDWHHVAATYTFGSGSSVELYLDGVLVSGSWTSGTGDDAPVIQDAPLFIGAYSPTSPYWRGGIDDARLYNRALEAAEITTLYNMGTPAGSSTALPQGCPNIGDVCDDGTIYAGLSPDGDVEMFSTQADLEVARSWVSDGANVDTSISGSGCSGNPCANPEAQTGEANTLILVSEDSDSTLAGFQTHPAAQYCYDLIAYGADDWYLPAQNEMIRIWANRTVGAFNGGYTTGTQYWTSTEGNANSARPIQEAGSSFGVGKWNGFRTRCVRKGPAPRCANPYGLEGQIIYNTTGDVAQYCDGARWIAIGKEN